MRIRTPKIIRAFFISWGFRIGLAVFAVVGVMSYVSLNNSINTNRWVNRTNQVLAQLTRIQLMMENAESSQQGYVVSDKAIFLKAFERALSKAPDEINSLLSLVSDNPTQVQNAIELRRMIDSRFDKMKNIIRMHQENAPASEIAAATDVDSTEEVRNRIGKMEEIETGLFSQRLANSAHQTKRTKGLLLIGGLLAALLLFANRLLQQQRAEQEWRKANLLNMIIKSVGDGLVVFDEQRNLTQHNPAADRMLGKRPSDLMYYDSKTREPIHPDVNPISRALRGETTDDFEVMVKNERHPAGVMMSVNSRPLVGSDDKIIGAVALFRDHTRRNQIELALRSEKDLALKSSMLKSEALSSMSHEIRTPMNGVLGMVTLLLDTTLNESQRSYAMTIKSSAEGLLSLINGILDHAKIEAGKLTLDNFDFHLPSLADDVIEMFRYQARSRHLELVKEISAEVTDWFHGDGNRIRQVLINLVGNAFKFTERGRIALKIYMVSKNNVQREIRFEVSDTGIGVSEANQKKLFQKFSQVHRDSTKYGGTGLGLLLCKQVVNLMGGQIGIQSREGEGSTFWFTVKVGPGMSRERNPRRQIPSASLTGHVLVVEDQPVNRQVVKSYLEKLNVTCDLMHDGRQALDAFSAEPSRYDLILMDVQMPVMDGFECCKEIRKFEHDKGIPHTPIVALTAEGRSQDRENCLAAGMDDFLSKPIDIEQFADVLKKWLRPSKDKPDPNQRVVDWTILKKLSELDSDGRPLDIALIEEFLRTSDALVADLEAAMNKGSAQTIRELAHAIKSPARTIGLTLLGDLCELIEDEKSDEAAKGRVRDVHDRSARELRDYLRQRSNQAA